MIHIIVNESKAHEISLIEFPEKNKVIPYKYCDLWVIPYDIIDCPIFASIIDVIGEYDTIEINQTEEII